MIEIQHDPAYQNPRKDGSIVLAYMGACRIYIINSRIPNVRHSADVELEEDHLQDKQVFYDCFL